MQQHITHPVTGIVASGYSAVSAYFDFFAAGLGVVSAFIGLIIGILSLANTWHNFKNRKK